MHGRQHGSELLTGAAHPAERRMPMPSDSDMAGPGAHETNAMNATSRDRADEAHVYAILALASQPAG